MRLALFSPALAMILGFAANRASICMVRAVAEMIRTGYTYMLRSIAKSVFWALAITVPIYDAETNAQGCHQHPQPPICELT